MKIKFLNQFILLFIAVSLLLPVFNALQMKASQTVPRAVSQPVFYTIKVVESSFQNHAPVVLESNVKTSECLNVSSGSGFLQGGSYVNLNQPGNCFNLSESVATISVERNLTVVSAFNTTKVFVLRSNEFLFDQIEKPALPVSEQAQSNNVFSLGMSLVLSSFFLNRRSLIRKNFVKFKQQLNFYQLCVMRC